MTLSFSCQLRSGKLTHRAAAEQYRLTIKSVKFHTVGVILVVSCKQH